MRSNLFRLQIRILIIIAAFVPFSLSIVFFFNHFRQEEYDKVRDRLEIESRALLFSLEDLNLEAIHCLDRTREELLKHPVYLEARRRLLGYAATMGISPELLYIIVRSSPTRPSTGPANTKPAEVYYFILGGREEYSLRFDDPFYPGPNVAPAFSAAFRSGEIQTPPVYSDDEGRWLTVVIPVKNSAGEVYAIHKRVLRIEFVDSLVWESIFHTFSVPAIFLLASLLILILFLDFIFRPFNRIVELFGQSELDSEIELSAIKATGEFAFLRDSLQDYNPAIHAARLKIQEILANIQEGLLLLNRELEQKKKNSLQLQSFPAGKNFLRSLVGSLARLATRLADKQGKTLAFVSCLKLKGLPLQLEPVLKNILIQLVRNSVTHGIELPEQRISQGKLATGSLRLAAVLRNKRLTVSFKDDGKGICCDTLRQAAVEKGLFTAEQAAVLGGQQLLNVMFSPGISASRSAGMEARRGLGLDMIRREVEQAGGKIRIRSKENEYTQFIFTLPVI